MENKVIKNAGFHHLALYASDFERTMRFYQDGLGCRFVRSWGEGQGRVAMVDFGGGSMLEIFAKGTAEPQQNAKFIHLAIATTDPDGAYAAALAAGAKPQMEPKDTVIASDPPLPVRIAFVKGPDEEIIEFFCDKTRA